MKYNSLIEINRRTLAIALIDRLEALGFSRCESLEGGRGDISEAVYIKPVEGYHVIAVYTSCNQRNGAWEARVGGKDAIRISALYMPEDSATRGLSKFKRVNRAGSITSIIDRVEARINEAWKVASHPNRCEHCGGAQFLTKKGNYCCIAFCWK